jgi:hypothetical protein
MDTIRQGMKTRLVNPDWTLISLAIYLTLPFVWWNVIGEGFSIMSSYSIEYMISLLIWGAGLIGYLRSQATWQRALCLQLGMMLAPTTADVISRVFWSSGRWWLTDLPVPPWKIAFVFLSYGLPWFGLMFAPALLVPLKRMLIPSLRSRPSQNINPLPWKSASFWLTLLSWTAATCAGWVVVILPGIPDFLRILSVLFLMGLLQGLVLQRFWHDTLRWTLATAAGLLCGGYLSIRFLLLDLYLGMSPEAGQLDNLFYYSTLGVVIGLFQWFVLKRHVQNAYWWILVNMLAWTVGRLLFVSDSMGFVVISSVVGVATGTMLLWLSRYSMGDVPDSSNADQGIRL